jgi:lipid A oxidase
MSRSLQALAIAGLCAFSLPAAAETQISVFGGANSNLSSDVKVGGTGTAADGTSSIDWDGNSFELPPYWGVRGTYWLSGSKSNWGFAIDFVHSKAVADLDGAAGNKFDRLEFTDGNNILLFDVLYRFNPLMNGKLVPYVGAGIGVTIPHVEVTPVGGSKTYEYQLTGVAAQVLAGLEYKLNEKWSVFAEGRFSYSHIEADLQGGGTLETDLWSPQIAVGVSYRF